MHTPTKAKKTLFWSLMSEWGLRLHLAYAPRALVAHVQTLCKAEMWTEPYFEKGKKVGYGCS